MNYRILPSDLAFLYEGCKRCFYLKMTQNITQPSTPMPGIFSKITNLLKNHYAGKRTNDLHIALPPGTIEYGEKYIKSSPIVIQGYTNTCFISGRFDIVIKFDDGTYGVVDFKTGNPNESYAKLYSRQLHAYAYALEYPGDNALSLVPVTRMGLLYFYPSGINQQDVERLAYEADITWIEVKKNEPDFLNLIGEILGILELSKLPPSSSNCPWCTYFRKLGNVTYSP